MENIKNIKTKFIVGFGGIGALCALCCSFPIMGMLGLGALEVIFCESKPLFWMGISLLVVAGFLLVKKYSSVLLSKTCPLNCGCKN